MNTGGRQRLNLCVVLQFQNFRKSGWVCQVPSVKVGMSGTGKPLFWQKRYFLHFKERVRARTAIGIYNATFQNCDSYSGKASDKLFVIRLTVNFSEICHSLWEKMAIQVIRNDVRMFKHFSYAYYATDVTFQQSDRRSKNMDELKNYFSGKHKRLWI